MTGYCMLYERYMAPKDVRRKGCMNRKKQKRYGRKVCRHLQVFVTGMREEKVYG